jgi:hypothetical protein
MTPFVASSLTAFQPQEGMRHLFTTNPTSAMKGFETLEPLKSSFVNVGFLYTPQILGKFFPLWALLR